ncbi:MAG TPA: hypothetical protein VMM38_14445 [Aridibacter sp.]|nr:hypothetical protein [Aridibacter sp.]
MIVPSLHDRLLLAGVLIGAIGVLLSRTGTGAVTVAGLVLSASGVILVLAGAVMKIRKGR